MHRDLPDFLEAALWEEVAAPFDEGSAPPGFEAGAARYAIAVQGFYIFWRRTRAEIFARRTAAPYSA
ncbi:MAG TPA: hypothetical protein VHL98_15370 [Microvirga sp.]|nr:hypothetical protein [Microvirga sp.]